MTNLDNWNYKRSFVDQSSGAQIQLSNLHAHTHRGKSFKCGQVSVALANNAFQYYEITPSINDNMHLKGVELHINDGPVRLKLIENPILTTGVTSLPLINKNRTPFPIVPIVSGVTIKSNPTSISGGTELEDFLLGSSGAGSKEIGISFSRDDEYVFPKGGNVYLITIQNVNGSAINLTSRLVWYE